MSQVACRSCKKPVDRQAKVCPHCGANKPGIPALHQRPIAYVVAMGVGAIAYLAASPDPTPPTPVRTNAPLVASAPAVTPPSKPAPTTPPAKTKADFDAARPAMMKQLREAIAKRDYYSSLGIGNDYKLVADDEFLKLWARVIDLDRAQAEAKFKALAKKPGVRLGMTPDQVIGSSWGKPQRVNRTISVRGEREQWVYDGGNYLYFENGVLTSIQN